MSVQDYIMRILMISNLHQILFGDRIESTEMGGARSTYREEEIFIQCLAGNTEVNRPLGIPMRRWEDSIKMDLSGSGLGGMERSGL